MHYPSRQERLIKRIIKNQERLMADITALNAAVVRNTEVTATAVAKLTQGSVPTQAEVDAVTAQVDANSQALTTATPPA